MVQLQRMVATKPPIFSNNNSRLLFSTFYSIMDSLVNTYSANLEGNNLLYFIDESIHVTSERCNFDQNNSHTEESKGTFQRSIFITEIL
jgi:hypothetical protein